MITMTVVVKVRPEKQEEFLQAMLYLNGDREIQEGLRKSTLYQETDDKTGFSLIYEWETQDDLDRTGKARGTSIEIPSYAPGR